MEMRNTNVSKLSLYTMLVLVNISNDGRRLDGKFQAIAHQTSHDISPIVPI